MCGGNPAILCGTTLAERLKARRGQLHCRKIERSATMELQPRGEVTERFKVLASKASVRETVPWVRIPPSPPSSFEFVSCHQLLGRVADVTAIGLASLSAP